MASRIERMKEWAALNTLSYHTSVEECSKSHSELKIRKAIKEAVGSPSWLGRQPLSKSLAVRPIKLDGHSVSRWRNRGGMLKDATKVKKSPTPALRITVPVRSI